MGFHEQAKGDVKRNSANTIVTASKKEYIDNHRYLRYASKHSANSFTERNKIMAWPTITVQEHFLDRNSENTSVKYHFTDTLSGLAEWLSLFTGVGPYDDVKDAIAGVSDAALQRTTASFVIESPSDAPPATVDSAQREHVLRIKLKDTVTSKFYRMVIPCYKPSLLTDGSDIADFSSGALATLKTQIEANCVSEMDNPLIVVSGEFTGRNG